jgi:lipopolysaccharide biosynthesis regulator YciM
MPQTALKEMINSLEADNLVGAAVAIEQHYENPFIISVLEDKASKNKDYVLEIAENLSSSYHDLDFDDDMQEAFAAFVEIYGTSETFENFTDSYQGQFDDDTSFAEHLIDECGVMDIPEDVLPYFDYEKFARDIMIDDYTTENNHYFSTHW